MLKFQIRTIALASVLFYVAIAAAQNSPTTPVTAQQSTGATVSVQSATRDTQATSAMPVIAPGDLLDVSVFDVPELTQQVRIGADGKAQLALIGSTPLAGLTAEQASELIARELRKGNFLVRPQVNVLIKESRNEGISVLGEVQHPGVYQVIGPRTLLDVISIAGGLTNVADTRITVKHRSAAEESVTVKLKNDDAKVSLATDVEVYPGDLVIVPRAGIVYVLGEVARPGGFVMQDSGKITLLQALAQAGGTRSTASANHALVLRKSGDEYVTSKVNLDKISRGQERDLELNANDVVFVPNSRLKNAARNTGSIAAAIGTTSIYAIIH